MFALGCVVVCAILGGWTVDAMRTTSGLPLPSLLGMLVAGSLLRNLPGLRSSIGENIDVGASSALRTMALGLILARAGLGLDLVVLARLKWAALRLAAIPCLVEATAAGFISYFLFYDDAPVAWCAALGFAVAAVSPAVVVPSLLSLEERGYGTKTGIPTLVVASAALDDVFSLAAFGVSVGAALRSESSGVLPNASWTDGARAPLELALGVGLGFVGSKLAVILSGKTAFDRAVSLILCCMLAAFGLKGLGFSGASALATLTLAALVAPQWDDRKAVASYLNLAWTTLAQPCLFGLVGAAVDLTALGPKAPKAILLILACAFVRFGATAIAVTGLSRLEDRLFVAIAWLPKATVQAAIGALPLDLAETDTQTKRAQVILLVAVLAILITAPTGAVAIALAGPRLLLKDDQPCEGGLSTKVSYDAEHENGAVEQLDARDCQDHVINYQDPAVAPPLCNDENEL